MTDKRLRLLPGVRIIIILIASLFSLFPFFIMLRSSFEGYNDIVSLQYHLLPIEPSVHNYLDLLTNYQFLKWFVNSVIVAVAAIAINIVIDTLAA